MKKKKKRGVPIRVPVASMGDIAFLLIIFFMVCSRFAQEAVKVQPPRALDADEMKENQVSVTIDADGRVYFQGREVPGAEAVEWGVRSMVEGKTKEQARMVMFRCDRSVSKHVFEPVIEAIARGGGLIAAIGDKDLQKKTEPAQAPEVPPGAPERDKPAIEEKP